MRGNYRKKLCLLLAALLCAALLSPAALAAESSGSNRFNVEIVLDASGSMQKTDPSGYRYEAIRLFANLLAERGNVLGGLVFSTGIDAQQSPAEVTDQTGKNAVIDQLESVPPTGGWTNIGQGLSLAVDELNAKGRAENPSVILLLSDGNTDMATPEEKQASLDLKAEAIQKARESSIAIYSVCLNANRAADTSEMAQISKATGGVFLEVGKAEDLRDVFNTFYSLIYGTSVIELIDAVFPASGLVEKSFDIPGLGVEEVNIIIYGKAQIQLFRPDGTEYPADVLSSNSFTMVKIPDVVPGTWRIAVRGVPGDQIKVNMVYNPNLTVEAVLENEDSVINPADPVAVTATLSDGGTAAADINQYSGYTAVLRVLDAYGAELETVPMTLGAQGFEAWKNLSDGSYYFQVSVSGNYLEKQSARLGPLRVSSAALTEEEKNNTPPTPVEDVVKKTVYLWPGKGGSLELDLNTLATDAQDAKLDYRILSTAFLEGTDYTLDGDTLRMGHFSLSKGSFDIQATDSGGLSCRIQLIVTSRNVGTMTLIGLGTAALVAVAILGIVAYILGTIPFWGTITVESCVNGQYRRESRDPRRGRCKLSAFGVEPVGLNATKSYFQATKERRVEFVPDRPVFWNGREVKRVPVASGMDVTIRISAEDPRSLRIHFDSRERASLGGRSSKAPKPPKPPKTPKPPKRPPVRR